MEKKKKKMVVMVSHQSDKQLSERKQGHNWISHDFSCLGKCGTHSETIACVIVPDIKGEHEAAAGAIVVLFISA